MSQSENTSKYLSKPKETTGMPSGILNIVGNEAAERFSYYGMKVILPIFMTKHLIDSAGNPDFLSEEQAREALAWFGFVVYATPFLGAILSDWKLGKYLTIVLLSMLYVIGHGILSLIDLPMGGIEPRWILFAGLGVIALGAGGIKPCVTSHVGDQFGSANKHLLPRVYGWFYFSINFGSLLAYFLMPLILEYWGATWAFGIPGILMAIAAFVFWQGRHKFIHIPAGGAAFIKESLSKDGLSAMLHLTPLLLLVAMFWSLFDQSASTWILQAEKMNRVLFDFQIFGQRIFWEPLSSQVGLANPLLVLMLIPIFTFAIYPLMGRVFTVTPLRKIGIGMFTIVPAFAISGLIQEQIDLGNTPWIGWQVAAYAILTAAEVMVSITMLEFFYTQSPKKMKSLIMAFCMLSVSVGNLITALVNRFIQNADGTSKLPGASYYWFFTILMLVTAVVYVAWSQFYRGKAYIQDES